MQFILADPRRPRHHPMGHPLESAVQWASLQLTTHAEARKPTRNWGPQNAWPGGCTKILRPNLGRSAPKFRGLAPKSCAEIIHQFVHLKDTLCTSEMLPQRGPPWEYLDCFLGLFRETPLADLLTVSWGCFGRPFWLTCWPTFGDTFG